MEKQKYTTIQIKKETHILLQDYCKEHGFKLSGLIESMINQRINPKVEKPTNVLKVRT
jgi:hypothetical protein